MFFCSSPPTLIFLFWLFEEEEEDAKSIFLETNVEALDDNGVDVMVVKADTVMSHGGVESSITIVKQYNNQRKFIILSAVYFVRV